MAGGRCDIVVDVELRVGRWDCIAPLASLAPLKLGSFLASRLSPIWPSLGSVGRAVRPPSFLAPVGVPCDVGRGFAPLSFFQKVVAPLLPPHGSPVLRFASVRRPGVGRVLALVCSPFGSACPARPVRARVLGGLAAPAPQGPHSPR